MFVALRCFFDMDRIAQWNYDICDNFWRSAKPPTPILPDPKLTPGDTFDVTPEDVCVPGYAKKVRAVPAWLKRRAYAEYGITQYKTGDYEVDHLIPLSLGGSNSIRNLWPQSTKTSLWNSYVKDALERKLHKLVCAGQLDLQTAQREIASDWIEAYKKYVRTSPPGPKVRETKPAPATPTASEVWVNTRSGKYWKPGSRFYGKTKQGEFMSELDALDSGFPSRWYGPIDYDRFICTAKLAFGIQSIRSRRCDPSQLIKAASSFTCTRAASSGNSRALLQKRFP